MIINRKLVYGFLATLLAIVLILALIIFHFKNNSRLRVAFLDVGQGDAILVESGSNQLLIDGGKNSTAVLSALGEFMPFWDKTIEAVLVTHPDSDHFAGLIGVLKNYQVKNIIRTNAESSSELWSALKTEVKNRHIPQLPGENGTEIIFPNNAVAKIIYPFGKLPSQQKNTNLGSIVTKISFGKNNFLLTGDLPFAGETKLLDAHFNLQSNVLKVGHHGSKYSTGDKFLDAVNPQDAVISVGAKNRYHHPADEVLAKLKRKSIRIWRTDKDGNIVYDCNPLTCHSYSAE